MRRTRRSWEGIALALVLAPACESIEPVPLSSAPLNLCSKHPCDGYAAENGTAARCQAGDRCEIASAGGRPEFPFWIVVHVPDTSIYASGSTHVLFSDERGEPSFVDPPITERTSCRPSAQCLRIGGFSAVQGSYRVASNAASGATGFVPIADGTSIPVRVVYEPLGNAQQATFPPLPLDVHFAASVLESSRAVFLSGLTFGSYRRVLYPQPPFDAFFPPTADAQSISSDGFLDEFTLGASPPNGKPLDDAASRVATVRREEGLEGFRVWLADSRSQRRISVLKTLPAGTDATLALHTTGESNEGSAGLRDDVDVIVAPPPSWTAVPTLINPLIGGSGLGTPESPLVFPALPPPSAVTGVVAQAQEGGGLLGFPGRVSFDSVNLSTRGQESELLHYATSVGTDDRGRFATVLPPGTYIATVEPDIGTGLAKARQVVVVDRVQAAFTLLPPRQQIVTGRAVLTDGRPLAEAKVYAQPAQGSELPPRPREARTAPDGSYVLELDPGSYTFTVVPQTGTGFPRVARTEEITDGTTTVPDIRVPAPTKLAFTLREPAIAGNAIARAYVRVFAVPRGTSRAPVEIGLGMTDANGFVEILLAQEPQ